MQQGNNIYSFFLKYIYTHIHTNRQTDTHTFAFIYKKIYIYTYIHKVVGVKWNVKRLIGGRGDERSLVKMKIEKGGDCKSLTTTWLTEEVTDFLSAADKKHCTRLQVSGLPLYIIEDIYCRKI
jgi:hypothetical protein